MTWLITGGAGYIGSHVVAAAMAAGHEVVIIDDLSTGFSDRIPSDVPFVQADIADQDAVRSIIREHNITGVVHLAAKKQVGESVEQPLMYWEWNVSKMISFLDVLVSENVRNFVYSSSAAVYGNPEDGVTALTELTPCKPLSPYGATKLAGEVLIESLTTIDKLSAVSLRYFNVAGTANNQLADRLALNLIPIALNLLEQGKSVTVFGADYPTADGTCIRDYVHVADLAEAHVAAMSHLESTNNGHIRLNIGTGNGASVLDIVHGIEQCSGKSVEWHDTGRRAGDPVSVVADVQQAYKVLGWKSSRTLQDIVQSAWDAWPKR
jgi:UDP-glucose 4-epimerase